MELQRPVLAILLALFAVMPQAISAQAGGNKLLHGHVFGTQDQPLPGAIVYLKNSRTQAIKVSTADQEGVYHFPQVPQHIQFEVWAEYNGSKSESRNLSDLDIRTDVTANLRIDTQPKK